MEIKRIFISCSRLDGESASNLTTVLESRGFEVDRINPNDEVLLDPDEVNRRLAGTDIVVVIITENFLKSRYSMLELGSAFMIYNKPVIAIAVGDVIVPGFLADIYYKRVNDLQDVSTAVLEVISSLQDSGNSFVITKTKQATTMNDAINALKQALNDSQLTLVCGAGISIPSGIPAWEELLVKMIDKTVFHGKHAENPSDTSAEELRTYMSQSAIILGKQIKNLSRDSFEECVKRALYEDIYFFDDFSGHYTDTNLMNAIAELARPKRRGRQLESIITFNFDDIIETKLKKSSIDYCSIWKEGQSHDVYALPIYHVHGFLPYNDHIDEPNLVFSEEAYHSQFIDPYSWSNLLQLNVFSNNVCLFVGISLSDPNLRRLLDISWRRNQRKRHYIIMKKTEPQDTTENKQEERSRITDIADWLFEQDANFLGINVIWCNNYDEIPEILRKIAD